MKFRVVGSAMVLACCAALAQAQTQPLRLQISGGRVTLHADNVPVRSILAEWARLGGSKIVNGERIAGPPLTLELEGVSERQALDIILRGVSGYVVAAREPGASGASMYDRIMILPTSAVPRNPPPAAVPTFNSGIVRPINRDDDADVDTDNPQGNDGVPLGRPIPIPRPIGVPNGVPINGAQIPGVPFNGSPFTGGVPPPISLNPDNDQPQQPPPGVVVPTPTNPFGLPAGSSLRPGVITPVAPPPTQQAPPGPGQN